MGYNTKYKIVSVDPGENVAALERAFSLHAIGRDSVSWFGVGVTSTLKWYEHEQHIADAMVESGVVRLVLHGEGEEQGDVWDKTFVCSADAHDALVTVHTTRCELIPRAPSEPAAIETSKPGWSKLAEQTTRTSAAVSGRRRIPGCPSNECAIRNTCTGHLNCPGGLGHAHG